MQPNCFTTLKKMTLDTTCTFVLCIQPFNTTKSIQQDIQQLKIFNPEKHDVSWYSIIKCKVIPPRKLYHPVLPQHIKVVHEEEEGKKRFIAYEKLIFTLCKACAEKTNQNEYEHTDDGRSFIGTWTTDEVNKALEKGYKGLRTYEV